MDKLLIYVHRKGQFYSKNLAYELSFPQGEKSPVKLIVSCRLCVVPTKLIVNAGNISLDENAQMLRFVFVEVNSA